MHELNITTHKLNRLIDPALHIWGWEVGVYLFLGGLCAGVLILGALTHLMGLSRRCRFAAGPLLLLGPVLLSLGMLALFLDLEHKRHVWRFYASFQITSPMSWGAWILLLVYPLNLALILAALPGASPAAWAGLLQRVGSAGAVLSRLRALCERHLRPLALAALGTGIGLGLYTGVLLSANAARPFWNNVLLAPIFLVSGVSTAAALVLLFAEGEGERHLFARLDAGLLAAELALLLLFVFGMVTSTETLQQAARPIFGGDYTAHFWVGILGLGLGLPLSLELAELRGRSVPRLLAPGLILVGGLCFRLLVVHVGQLSAWAHY